MATETKPKALKITTPKFRVSFPNLDQPRGFEGQEPKYSITMLFPKNTDMGWIREKLTETMVAKFGPNKANWPKGLRNPIRDGDEMESPLKGYDGHYFIKASTKDKPGCVNAQCDDIIDVRGELYAGCYARATVALSYYDKAGNKGIGVWLNNIQKLGDGESFGGKRDAKSDFDAVEGAKVASNAAAAEEDELFI